MNRKCWWVAVALALSGPCAVLAQTPSRVSGLATETRAMNEAAGRSDTQAVIDQFVARFEKLAGSKDNSRSLVVGLRTGQEIVLKPRAADTKTAPAVFTPPTGTMSFSNIFLTLSIAQDSLSAKGITQAAPDQIQAVLMGGKIPVGGRPVDVPGILVRRLTGEGWGIIASTMGIDIEPIVAGMRAEREKFQPMNFQGAAIPAVPGAPAGQQK